MMFEAQTSYAVSRLIIGAQRAGQDGEVVGEPLARVVEVGAG